MVPYATTPSTSPGELSGTYRARWIVPMSRPPLAGGWISLHHGRVTALGEKAPPSNAVDLGDVALLPGLINAHTHLEFSDLTEPLGQVNGTLPDWIAEVLRHRAAVPRRADPVELKRQAIESGLRESAAAGVRLVGEIATAPWPLEELHRELSLDQPELIAFGEVLGLQPPRQQQTWQIIDQWSGRSHDRITCGISPHAPYSTSLGLIQRAVRWSHENAAPLAMHVAESTEELELIDSGTGPFRTVLERLGLWDRSLFPWQDGIQMLLQLLATAHRALVVHGNYFNEDHIEFLASQPQMSVVYCPRTHHFFGHSAHPVARLRRAGVRVALGTDSRASNPDLNLWNEVRFLSEQRGDLEPEAIVRMATIDAADAFGRPDCGRLSLGALPGLAAIPTTAKRTSELWPSLCQSHPSKPGHSLPP